MTDEIRFLPEAACDRCGHFGAYQFEGKKLCLECYETRGSCCQEFEHEDGPCEDPNPPGSAREDEAPPR